MFKSIFLYTTSLLVLVLGCGISIGEDEGISIDLPPPTYQEFPRWSPDGNTVLYYHSGLQLYDPSNGLSIHDPDSAGIWAMSPEGKNQRKILNAGYADWSPDGEWIVYVAGAQIFKVRFNGISIDTSSVEQLTFEGRNFFPDWSPDGEWIGYDNTTCGSSNEPPPAYSCGVLTLNLENDTIKLIKRYSRMPTWNPINNEISFVNRAVLPSGKVIGDSLWTYSFTDSTTSFLTFIEGDNRYPKYSPHGHSIVFSSNVQIWTMNEDGTGLTQLTFDEGGTMPDWSPDGKQIIYMGPKGTIWVMDADGSNQTSLTARPEGSIN